MILNSAYGHSGIELKIKNIRNNGVAKEKENLSVKMYNKLKDDVVKYNTFCDDIFNQLGNRVIKVYKRPTFEVLSNGNALIDIGTSYLLLTKVGCISVNIYPFKGVVIGCEKDKSWFLYGKKTYCEIDSPLYKFNSEFVNKLQDSIKFYIASSSNSDVRSLASVWYVRNIIAFTSKEVFITDERNETKHSSQVTSLNDLISLLCTYIDNTYNSKSEEEKSNLVKAQKILQVYLDSLLVKDKEYSLGVTPRTPIPVIFDDDVKTDESSIKPKNDVNKYQFCSKVVALEADTVEGLAEDINNFLASCDGVVRDIKFSSDLLSCIILLL